jgi:catechol 2,3-dioxygenase-like lactoylglutathione lyase family enzyme
VTTFLSPVPIIPTRDVTASTAWYRDTLDDEVVRAQDDCGIVGRGGSWIHRYGPSGIAPEDSDTMIRVGWRASTTSTARASRRASSIRTGGSAGDPGGPREFAVLDRDGNRVTCFEPEASQ